MRVIRMSFLALLALLLVLVALANRQPVVLRAFPGQLDTYLGSQWQLTMPLFLIIFLALMVGMVLGLVWEWLREAQLRSESARRARDITELERRVGAPAGQRDEVLALLDNAPSTVPSPTGGSTLPARR